MYNAIFNFVRIKSYRRFSEFKVHKILIGTAYKIGVKPYPGVYDPKSEKVLQG